MTSVLNYGGLNYQVGNPVRAEMQNIRRELTDTRSLVETSVKDSVDVRTDNLTIKRAIGQLQSAATQLQATVTQLQASLQNLVLANQALSSNLVAVAQHLNFTLPNTVGQQVASQQVSAQQAQAQAQAQPQAQPQAQDDEDEEEEAPPPPPKKKGGRPRTVPTGVVVPQEFTSSQSQSSGFINVQ